MSERGVRARSPRRPLLELWFGCAMIILVAFRLLGFRAHVDDDLWLHLRIGEELRDGTRFGGLPDPLVLLADRPYTPSQWLSEILGSLLYEWTGLTGIHLLRVLAIVTIAALVYATGRHFVAPSISVAVTFFALFATSTAWAERPQLVGLVMQALVALLCTRAWRRGRRLWPVIPLMWLWACLHGTWILGLLTTAVFVMLMLRADHSKSSIRRCLLVWSGSLAVVALTPLGPTALLQPFAVNDAAKASVNEWQTPTWDNPTFLVTAVLALTSIGVALTRRRSRPEVLLLSVASLSLAAYSVRTVAFAAILAAPALGMATRPRELRMKWRLTRTEESLPWLVCAASAAAIALVAGPPPQAIRNPALVAALEQLPSGTRVAADVGVSGWLLFHEPQLALLRDLRAESYSPNVAGAFDAFWRAQRGWADYLAQRAVSVVLAPEGHDISTALALAGWTKSARGDGYLLYERP